MADQCEQLKAQYQSVLKFMQSQNVQLEHFNLQNNNHFIRAVATSKGVKNHAWDQITLVDPSYSELIADIQVPIAQAAAATATGAAASRTHTTQTGDSLPKISKQFYGDANQYIKIFEANRD